MSRLHTQKNLGNFRREKKNVATVFKPVTVLLKKQGYIRRDLQYKIPFRMAFHKVAEQYQQV